MAETPNEFKLKNAPEDGISAVKFGTTNQFLLASSWDQTVRLYDVISNNLRIKYSHSEPVLDCCFYVSMAKTGWTFKKFTFWIKQYMVSHKILLLVHESCCDELTHANNLYY